MTLLSGHWFDLLQSFGIIASLYFTYKALREQTRQLQASNLLLVTQHHRELWGQWLDQPSLVRIFDTSVDLVANPITERERMFVTMMFLHSAACWRAAQVGAIPVPYGFAEDLQDVLTYPIPRAVWQDISRFQDPEFATFMAVHGSATSRPRE